MNLSYIRLLSLFVALSLLSVMPSLVVASADVDSELRDLLAKNSIRGDMFGSRELPDINDPLPQLGKLLFFTKALSGDNDTACASCHHPLLGGGDDLSLSVGVGSVHPALLGIERRHNGDSTVDPEADGGPNAPRNAQTTFNVAFWDRSLFHDGRAFVGDAEVVAQGQGQHIHTPDSVFGKPDPNAGDNLVEAQARFPVTATTEMRGFRFGNETAKSIRDFLAQKLATQFRQGRDGKSPWLPLFQTAFNKPLGTAQELITYDNIARALSEYQRSQVFVSSPWLAYVKGDDESISLAAKRGAILFYKALERGGAGCASCHSGDFFSDENYHNIAMPQFGRGKSTADNDFGRYSVTKSEADRFKFRTPTLLNVTETGPYGHTGAFETLKEIVLHHTNPGLSVTQFDYSLKQLSQFRELDVTYEHAKPNTLRALKKLENSDAIKLLQNDLSEGQVDDLVDFLATLTDPCIRSASCLSAWLPDTSDLKQNPDGLGLDAVFTIADVQEAAPLISLIAEMPANSVIAELNKRGNRNIDVNRVPRAKSTLAYPDCVIKKRATASARFVDVTRQSGITHRRNVSQKNKTGAPQALAVENTSSEAMLGSVASADYNADCFPDLLFESGEDGAGFLYKNNAGKSFERDERFDSDRSGIGEIVTPVFVDLNGDGWLDIFSGNIRGNSPKILFNDGQGEFLVSEDHSIMQVYRATAGAALADIDQDGDLDLALAHWSFGTGAEDEHLWENRGNGYFFPAGKKFSIYGEFHHRDNSLTPRFADIDNDGDQDLLYASDFSQSLVFTNEKGIAYKNVTDPAIISDENGMGSAVADFDNDGYLDWFVSSISAEKSMLAFGQSGNRLYMNAAEPSRSSVFSDATEEAGVRDGGWAWGACAADFDNDGNMDIFHTTGAVFGKDAIESLDIPEEFDQFLDQPSRLFMSNGDGTFSDKAVELGLEHYKSGRGIACVDYDRDGDIDVVIANNTGVPNIYRNDIHNGNHSLTIKLIGAGANTEAIGARVYIKTGKNTQMQEVAIRNHYMSQSPTELHFGLGQVSEIDSVKVVWPSQQVTLLNDVASDQYLYVSEDKGLQTTSR